MIESADNNEKSPRKSRPETINSSTPVLDNFSRDLIKLAEQGKLDPVIGREQEINLVEAPRRGSPEGVHRGQPLLKRRSSS